jgi:anaerobic magnesium-protoporphyrin IX monomethyl ester cyclase
MIMNVLLIRPPDPLQHVKLLSHTKPLNLAYIASYLLEKKLNVKIIDYEIEPFKEQNLLSVLKEFNPAVVGFSCFTPTIKNGHKICRRIKNFNKNITTVVGGPHLSGLPARTMEEFADFDFGVYGEGEITFHELCLRLNESSDIRNVKGILYRENGKIIQTPERQLIDDIDILPFPARNLIDYDSVQAGHSARGFSNEIRAAEVFTSRGCPYACSFCAIQATFGRSVRFRNLDCVEEEIRECQKRYDFNHIIIADDTFSLDPKRAEKLCGIFGRSGIRSWNCDTRVNTVSRELLKAMKDSGCMKVAYGVESGSPRIIDRIGKKITVEQVENAVHWTKEAGIKHIEGNFIIGADPTETMEDLAMTQSLIMKLPWTFVSVTVIVPYPGTPVYQTMKEKNQIFTEEWEDFVMFGKVPKWRTDNFSSEELLRLQKKITRDFYLNPRYIWNQLKTIKNLVDVKYYFNSGISYLKWYFINKL